MKMLKGIRTILVRPRRPSRTQLALLGALFVVCLTASPSPTMDEEDFPGIVAIVHPNNPISSLNIHELRHYYSTRKSLWKTGRRVNLILPETDSKAMGFLLSRVMPRMDEECLSRFYLQPIYQQKIQTVPSQMSTATAIAAVRNNPNALALVHQDRALDSARVRVLHVD